MLLGALLLGCPQLLDDSFDTPALPATGLDSGGPLPGIGSDAGAGPSGAGGVPGAGGAPNAAGSTDVLEGMGGSAELVPDASAAGAAGAEPNASPDAGGPPPPLTELGGLLLHRYRFDGSGSTVADSVGTAHGAAVGASLANTGKLVLSGIDQYVDLPDGLISSLGNVTVEAWVNWQADPSSAEAAWQNVFDFGNSVGSQAVTHLYVTGKSSDSDDVRAGYTLNGYNNEVFVDGERPLPLSANTTKGTQVALVVNQTSGSLALYVDGALEASLTGQVIDLSAVVDVNNWLGRSQYGSDPEFQGEFLDFRIYGSALRADQITLSFGLGPDAEL